MHRLVIIEDQTAIREMLAELLSLEKAYMVVGQSGDGREALELCIEARPDLVVLDAMLPSLNGVELLRRLSKAVPTAKVLVFSGIESPVIVRQMLEAGARGFVEKSAGFSEFKRGLAAVALGGTHFGPAIEGIMRSSAASTLTAVTPDLLTGREREVLQLVAEGHSTKGIGSRLGISAKTVDNHRTNLMRKLDIHDVASLTRHALEQGLIAGGGNG
jgi:DNA-binding NarL/FixJ family response regulator